MGDIVVGVDGSPAGSEALLFALREASDTNRRLVAIRSWQVPSLQPSIFMPIQYDVLHTEVAAEQRQLLERLLSAARELQSTVRDVVIEPRIVEGPAADVLILASRSADLVVVGARGAHAWERVLLGSVSAAVVAHAHCPVAVVHSEGGDGLIERARQRTAVSAGR